MRIQILPSAIEDLDKGWDFYEAQEPGVGDYFQSCLFSDIDSLVLHGGIHREIFGYHRLLSKRFPYAIYYKSDRSGLIIVHRVLDCRRDPSRTEEDLDP